MTAGTKDRILGAAFEEFTRCGFAGARVDEIAARAGVNKALLYRHYGDKEQLFRKVLERKMAELGEIGRRGGDLAEAAGLFFDFHARNPWLTRLHMWEALDFGTGTVPNDSERCRNWEERVAMIADAQRAGTADPSLDARQAMFTLVSMVVGWFAFPQLARMIAGDDPYSPEALRARRAHVVEVARKILEVR